MSATPEKFDLKSHRIAEDKKAELLRLFPEIRTEGGKLDFDRLKLMLGEAVDVGKERYGMNWPGKADCFKTLQAPSMATLRPCPEESVNFDTTENMIIEGDNLEVLKLLQKSYLGKVKMIYIDPPYNSGHDFVYPDDYSESLQTYLEYSNQVDDDGKKFGTNTDIDGRFHSKWMSMIYPRLYLARNLLREDGVIFITIDDREVENLRKICDEIFGEENFVAQIVWEKIYTTKNDSSLFSSCHDYVLCYTRNSSDFQIGMLPRSEEMDARYTNPDNDPRGPWKSIPLYADGERKNGRFRIIGATGTHFYPPQESHWRYSEADVDKLISESRIYFGKDGNAQPNLKRFLSEVRSGVKSKTIWFHKEVGSNDTANRELKSLFGEDGSPFDFPKPTGLIFRMLQIAGVEKNDLVLDFFAGSGTTAHGVLVQNERDGGCRKYLLVQLPEKVDQKNFLTIADITKERVRRVIKHIQENGEGMLNLKDTETQDRGFRVFKLAESNFKPWNSEAPHEKDALTTQLELHIDHVRPDRSQLDLFYELLLKSGYPLTAQIEKLALADKNVFSVQDGALFICLEPSLTLELIRAMADRKPERVVCLDAGFAGNDQLKANAAQIFKTKGVARFQTV